MSDANLKTVVAQVAGTDAQKDKIIKEKVQVVIFELDHEEYAVNIGELREVIKMTELTAVPNAPEFIKGILNLRGKIVVVVDLEKRFNLVREGTPLHKHILITEVEENNFGVIVDQVKEVLWVEKEQIQPSPGLVSAKIHAEYLKGVLVLNAESKQPRLVILLDLLKLLQAKELLNLGSAIKAVSK